LNLTTPGANEPPPERAAKPACGASGARDRKRGAPKPPSERNSPNGDLAHRSPGAEWKQVVCIGSGHPRRTAGCARHGSRLSRHFSTRRRVSLHLADCRRSGRTGQVGTGLGTGRVVSRRDGIGTGSKRVGPEPGGMENGWDGIESRGTEVGTGLIRRGRDNLYEHGSSRP
jgi:hypothetical protein